METCPTPILNVEQLRAADAHTIANEPIPSAGLMERASAAFAGWFMQKFPPGRPIKVVCGTGNNGGDGLCIARLLQASGYETDVYIVCVPPKPSDDFLLNEQRLLQTNVPMHDISGEGGGFEPEAGDLVIDAIFGSGLSRPLGGLPARMVEKINQSGACIVAVDMPSGLYADRHTGGLAVHAHFTLSFETPKLAFMLPENHRFVGEWETVPIGLDGDFLRRQPTPYHYITPGYIQSLLKPLGKFAHKGTKGHALMIAGSHGKMGACLLASKAAVKAGAGLVTAYVPRCGFAVMQIAVPEVMVLTDKSKKHSSQTPPLQAGNPPNAAPRYAAIAAGPGLGTKEQTQKAVLQLLQNATQPLVLDADALNIIATNGWLEKVPEGSILTPHPKEFGRLFGGFANDFERIEALRKAAQTHGLTVLLKGAHTAVALPGGDCYFNCSGNPALATAGSGDILTGIIAAFVAQGHPPETSAILGVYLHGLAGDRAAAKHGRCVLAREIIDAIRY